MQINKLKQRISTAGNWLCGIGVLISFNLCGQNITIREFHPAPAKTISDVQEAATYLESAYPLLSNGTLQLQSFRQSPNAAYYTFIQTYQGDPVLGTQIKIAVGRSGQVLFTAGNFFDSKDWVIPGASTIQLPADLRTRYQLSTTKAKPVIRVDDNGTASRCYVFEEDFENDRSKTTLVISENGELINADDHRVYFSEPDTVIYGYAFKPDPLTSAGMNYGGEYDDNSDADNDALHAELISVTVRATYEGGYFYLRTDSLKLKDLAAPGDAVVIQMDDEFYYPRNDNNFEDVNTIYHIQNFDDYLLSIGYGDLYNFYIEIDPHGAGGADQSFFIAGAVPSIQYGEGGVDDAEDADVLIHEYAHALSHHAAPNSNSGTQRRAADEGYGDYFAVSYSRMFSDYNWENVFSWDGHNEFWSGRNANTTKHYPEDVSADFYATCEIWSGALMDIFDAIGKENCDKIVCEALYGSFEEMSLYDAAMVILNAEDLLFGGTYHEQVYDALDARGLLNPLTVEGTAQHNAIRFMNTAGFCLHDEPLEIVLPASENYVLHIYTIEGRLIYTASGKTSNIYINPADINTNICIISVTTPTLNAALELVRQ